MQSVVQTHVPAEEQIRRGSQRVNMQLGVLRDAGFEPPPGASILDLGCGNGDLVAEYRRQGYRAFGCDFAFKCGPQVDTLARQGFIRLIEQQPYRMPFDDASFDLVVSNEVFEHVQDYAATLAEHRRVLKPGGVGLHFIPSRYALIESHVFVPFATIFQNYGWLKFWAALGIRSAAQRGMSATEVARRNQMYLESSTNYLPKAQIRREFGRQFRHVVFGEKFFFKHSRRARALYQLAKFLPIGPLYSALRSRVVICINR